MDQFTVATPVDEEPGLDRPNWPPLDFVDTVIPPLVDALSALDYDVHTVRNPDRSSLYQAVSRALSDDESDLIIHAIGHGQSADDPNRLDLIPTCGAVGLGTNVSEWLSAAQKRGSPVLFLLDLCKAGRAARLPWLTALAGRESRAWVIASAGPNEDSYDGRFTRSVASVLNRLVKDGLGTDPSRRYVSFQTVARHIAETMKAAPGLPQTVHATPIDPAQEPPELRFFANPRYVVDPQRDARHAVESPLRSFLDELDDVLDAEHFLGRVGSHFAGRRRQLRALSPWLDGNAGTSGLRVVTGSPGSGKSALLGVLVCAAHPVLADMVPHVRARLTAATCPSRNNHMGAVHARQRRLDELVSSLGRQLHLPAPVAGWTTPELVQAVSAMSEVPVIVVDAVDEALDPVGVMLDLLLPLATASHSDETPICRLLVGLRLWPEFEPLQRLALESGRLVDLDTVSAKEACADLKEYLSLRLADMHSYAAASQRLVRRQLAATLAERLSVTEAGVGQVNPGWGAFLVAEMLAGYLDSAAPITTPTMARQVGTTVPRSLPKVLELDLGVRRDGGRLRATLAALAYAKGEGMPAEVVALVARGFSDQLNADSAAASLDAARFYLRTTVEQDGTTLYRLLHQSLADHLRRHPVIAPQDDDVAVTRRDESVHAALVFELLLRSVYNGKPGNWSSAPPYLLRHAVHHAIDAGCVDKLLADPEFLVHADATSLRSVLHRAKSSEGRRTGDIYSTSLTDHQRVNAATRRWILAVDAARNGSPELAQSLSSHVGSVGWRPRWATRFVPEQSRDERFGIPRSWVTAATCTTVDGRAVVAATNTAGELGAWDLETGVSTGYPRISHGCQVTSVACTDVGGRPVALTGGVDGVVRVWDLRSGDLIREQAESYGRVSAITCTHIDHRPTAIVCGDNATRDYDVASGASGCGPLGNYRWTRSVACTERDGRPIAVTGGNDHAVRVWDLATRTLIAAPPREHTDRIYAVDCTRVGTSDIAVTGGDDNTVRVWDLATGQAAGAPLAGHSGSIQAIACVTVDGREVALSGGTDRTVRIWDLRTHDCLDTLWMPAPVYALRVGRDGAVVVCTGQDIVVLEHFASESS